MTLSTTWNIWYYANGTFHPFSCIKGGARFWGSSWTVGRSFRIHSAYAVLPIVSILTWIISDGGKFDKQLKYSRWFTLYNVLPVFWYFPYVVTLTVLSILRYWKVNRLYQTLSTPHNELRVVFYVLAPQLMHSALCTQTPASFSIWFSSFSAKCDTGMVKWGKESGRVPSTRAWFSACLGQGQGRCKANLFTINLNIFAQLSVITCFDNKFAKCCLVC